MRVARLILPLLAVAAPLSASARDAVEASAPESVAVTVYRDPSRGRFGDMDRDWPRGFAMISETRQVTLPPGESTIRFTGVAEGMIAVSAIVTGLPGGAIEKNRNADLLSPAALVDGTLGNRVRITRTNPGTGETETQSAIIRTRADGGLVLQTQEGYEAVRCSGLPEKLVFDRVPDGLSAEPVFTIDTRDPTGGTYEVTLTYLSWGFDWEADYVATLLPGGDASDVRMRLLSWLTILNDNGQGFEDAELMAVAGTLNVVSDFEGLADPPQARPLRLTCYPLGSSLAGSPIPARAIPPPAPPPGAMEEAVMVTAQRRTESMMDAAAPIVAVEEELGDLKLYRVPGSVDVRAKGLKQVAFLNREAVDGRFLYGTACLPHSASPEPVGASILFTTENEEANGLGVALPTGRIAFFEPTSQGALLVGEERLRDYAEGQEVELTLGTSSQVFARCEVAETGADYEGGEWRAMRVMLSNANPHPVALRLELADPRQWDVEGLETGLKNGTRVAQIEIPANGSRVIEWRVRPAGS